MKAIAFLRRCLCLCSSPYSSSSTATTTTTTKKRIQQRLRRHFIKHQEDEEETLLIEQPLPPPSNSIVVGTIFGHRRGLVRLCFEDKRLSSTPPLLFELPTPTYLLAKEMCYGLLRITLECDATEMCSGSLHSVPLWTMRCNGTKVGFAVRRRVTLKDRLILQKVKSTSAGAGVLPEELAWSQGEGELIYMKAEYERVVGGCDSESYHLINPRGSPGQELSVFLIRCGGGEAKGSLGKISSLGSLSFGTFFRWVGSKIKPVSRWASG